MSESERMQLIIPLDLKTNYSIDYLESLSDEELQKLYSRFFSV